MTEVMSFFSLDSLDAPMSANIPKKQAALSCYFISSPRKEGSAATDPPEWEPCNEHHASRLFGGDDKETLVIQKHLIIHKCATWFLRRCHPTGYALAWAAPELDGTAQTENHYSIMIAHEPAHVLMGRGLRSCA